MLKLKKIKKSYNIGNIETKALNEISVEFREKEFVAILGASGSGKTTCLNIIGGLDRYDSGEMIIKGKNTKDFKEVDWDAYRNNAVGFVFQSYNLITHLSIVDNVELGMTLSGVSSSERKTKAIEALEKVGLKEHLHKRPNQLSGGQMQRVAIARALVNDPEILLCDEPTGALDTATSVKIMDLIEEISKDRLVIMVTHNPELAATYADRIIQFQDGNIIDDSNPYTEKNSREEFNIKKTSMNFFTALKLSFNNIKTKKGRTFLTAFASSIGIIGIAVILSLSTGFQKQIDKFQNDAMSEFPIILSQNSLTMTEENMKEFQGAMSLEKKNYVESDEVYLFNSEDNKIIHKNMFNSDFINYLDEINPEISNNIGYARLVNLNMIRKVDNNIIPISIASSLSNMNSSSMGNISSMQGMGLSTYPTPVNKDSDNYLKENYHVLAGSYPTEKTDLVLVVDNENKIDSKILKDLGFNTEEIKSIKFNDIIGTEFKLVMNNDYYVKTEFGSYLPNINYQQMYDSNNSITLKISGVVRLNEETSVGILASGIAYSDELAQLVISKNKDSEIVKAQIQSENNIMSMQEISKEEKEMFISVLGGSEKPMMIMIYPKGFNEKEKVVEFLDKYNEGKSKDDIIAYTDLSKSISDMTSGIMDAITLVLIAFAAISLVVSLIMISIITYTSVLERTKEIGILKALGARKKDITRVFDAETCILGVFSGTLGIIVAYVATIPINAIIYNLTELKNVAQLQISHAITLIIISTILTVLGGHIPALMASKKDAVEALRSE